MCVTAILALRLVEDRPGLGFGRGADIPGALLVTAGMMLGVYGILQGGESGWGSASTVVPGVAGVVFVGAFLQRQRTIANPLMPLHIFRSRNVSGSNAIMALLVAGMFAMFFLGALYMQRILGYDPLQVGLAYLPATIVMAILGLRFAETLIMRFGPRRILIPGLACQRAGAVPVRPHAGRRRAMSRDLLPTMLLMGLGNGLAFPALMTLAMSGATPEDSGLASGLVNTTVQAGGAIGLAALATVATARTDAVAGALEPSIGALNAGYHLAYVIGAVLVLAAIAIAVAVITEDKAAHGDAVPVDDGVVEPNDAVAHAIA